MGKQPLFCSHQPLLSSGFLGGGGKFTIIQHATNTEKNPVAMALGRLDGLKGGKARAKKLSPKRRRQIAVKATQYRWNRPELINLGH